ncbi:hypothetical protein AB0C34_22955 [Nocardia sp. NPDC049220]|uniref:hypothetical protein n=1 Tax=Nocardia sp. NPDC049220 TaxID=3155273 RepID=UPI0033CEFC2C
MTWTAGPNPDDNRRIGAESAVPDQTVGAIVVQQNATRLADLFPVRIGRMLQSPLAPRPTIVARAR